MGEGSKEAREVVKLHICGFEGAHLVEAPIDTVYCWYTCPKYLNLCYFSDAMTVPTVQLFVQWKLILLHVSGLADLSYLHSISIHAHD